MENALQAGASASDVDPVTKETTELTKQPAIIPVKRKVRAIQPSRFKEQQFLNTVYFCEVDSFTTRDDLLEPEFWAHVAKGVRPGDEIKVMFEDNSYWCWFLVTGAGTTRLTVKLLQEAVLQAQTSMSVDIGSYVIDYKGRVDKHTITRKADGKLMNRGISTKALAVSQAQNYQDKE